MARVVDEKIVAKCMEDAGIADMSKASIREIAALVDSIQNVSGKEYIRMELGVPGLPVPEIAVKAEIDALKAGVGAIYPNINGIPSLKKEASRFLKLFLNVEVDPKHCVPCVGSMQGGFATMLTLSRFKKGRSGVLFLDPGFPVHMQQARVMGIPASTFDIYEYRGEKLRAKLEECVTTNNVACILYSNPNNPSWICLTDDELKIIAEVAEKHDIVIIEDLAYFCMDFRKDYSKPGQPPYPSTIAHYTDKYVLLVSSSKAFSYAGQRMGFIAISDNLAKAKSDTLREYYSWNELDKCLILGTLYALSSGTTHSVQYGFAAILKAANDGEYNFVEQVREYGEKAHFMKKVFTDNGFRIVYDKDGDEPIADGFYFTVSYGNMNGADLLRNLLYYGVSAIGLRITRSEHEEGLRVCVSMIRRNQLDEFEKRIKAFNNEFGAK